MNLTLATRAEGPLTVVEVAGEVDVSTAPQLRETLSACVADGDHDLVVDLNDVTFLDSTGLGVLVGALKRISAVDGTLRLACSQPRLLKIMSVTGLTSVFAIHASVADAIADAGALTGTAAPAV